MLLKMGQVLLSLWAVLNLVASMVIIVGVVGFEQNAPAVHQLFDEQEVLEMDPRIRDSLNSVAVFANGLNAAFSLLALVVIWIALQQRKQWALFALAASFVIAWLAGTLGDYVVGNQHPEISVVSGLIVVVGILLAACSIVDRDKLRSRQ